MSVEMTTFYGVIQSCLNELFEEKVAVIRGPWACFLWFSRVIKSIVILVGVVLSVLESIDECLCQG